MGRKRRLQGFKELARRALSEPREKPSLEEIFRTANQIRPRLGSLSKTPSDFRAACSHVLGMRPFVPDIDRSIGAFQVTSEMEQLAQIYVSILGQCADTPDRPAHWTRCLENLGFGVVDDQAANAYAFKHHAEYYIAVTSGLLFRLRSAFALAMSNRELFPRITDQRGVPKRCSWKWAGISLDDPECLDKTLNQLPELYEEEERDLDREGREQALFCGAISYIWGHEWGHIIGGHLDLLESRGLQAVRSESMHSRSDDSTDATRVDRAMEMDADLLSLSIMGLSQMYSGFMALDLRAPDRDDIIISQFQHIEDFIIGAMSSMLLLEATDRPISCTSTTHPNPLVRFHSLYTHICQFARQGSFRLVLAGPLEILRSQVCVDVLEMAKALRLPQACILDKLTDSAAEEIDKTTQECLRDVVELRTMLRSGGE